MDDILLSCKLALRELRAGVRGFRIFLLCLALGTGMIVAVGSLTNAIHEGIDTQARALLGGDIELTLTNRLPSPEQISFFSHYGKYSHVIEMRAMIQSETPTLVELKAIDHTYPLIGAVTHTASAPLTTLLEDNGVLVEEILLKRLHLKIGDSITIGHTPLVIKAVITREPDRAVSTFTLGPRILISHTTLEKTGLLLPGSLIRHSYRIALHDPQKLTLFKDTLKTLFPKEPWRIKTTTDSHLALEEFISELQLFLTLAGLATLLIGGIGIAQSVKGFLEKKMLTIATLKALGASQKLVLLTYTFLIILISLIGCFIGIVIGTLATMLLLPYVAHFFPIISHHMIYGSTLLLACILGLLIVFSFSWHSLSQGIMVRPSALFRGASLANSTVSLHSLKVTIPLMGGLIATLLLSFSDKKITLGFIGASMICFALFTSLSYGIKALARRIHPKTPWLRLAITGLYRPKSTTQPMMLAIGVGLTVLLTLLIVEANFQKRINQTIPAASPSLFLIDIQPFQKEPLLHLLQQHSEISQIMTLPMVRGRISQLKGIDINEDQVTPEARWAIRGDRGFTYSALPPQNATIDKGTWWDSTYQGPPLISIDKKLLQGMGLQLGDRLTVNIAGEEIEATIANTRIIDYSTFQINFAIMFAPGTLEKFPSTWIMTFRLEAPEKEASLIQTLAQQFPNVSIIRISETIALIKEIIKNISLALSATVLLTLFAGLLVMAGALSASLETRLYDIVMLKVLGATQKEIHKAYLTEWLLLGVSTAFVAILLGTFNAWLILQKLKAPYFYFTPEVIIIPILGTISLFILLGFITHFRVFSLKASHFLRNE